MSEKKKKIQSSTMEAHDLLLRYRDGEGKEDFFDKTEYEVALVLLELSHPVVFSPFQLKWGRTRKRCYSVFYPPKILPEPMRKSLPSSDAGDMGSTSSSSCLTGEAKKTNPLSIKRGLEEEFSTTDQRSKPRITSQPSASSFSVFEAEMGLIGAQAGLVARPTAEKKRRRRDDQTLRHLHPLIHPNRTADVGDVETASLLQQARNNLEPRGIDLNLPAAEEGNRIAAMVGFQRVAVLAKAQAAAQARQRRLGLIRSKKPYTRFISQTQQH